MTDRHLDEGMKRAAMAGLGALGGLKSAHVPARLAARIPVIGPLLGLVVLAGGALAGAATAARQSNS